MKRNIILQRNKKYSCDLKISWSETKLLVEERLRRDRKGRKNGKNRKIPRTMIFFFFFLKKKGKIFLSSRRQQKRSFQTSLLHSRSSLTFVSKSRFLSYSQNGGGGAGKSKITFLMYPLSLLVCNFLSYMRVEVFITPFIFFFLKFELWG